MVSYGKVRFDTVFQPVSGKAVPVYQGEVLRITLIEGPQCVDFNCFNLHDYKEFMSTGCMRWQGFRMKKGDLLISNLPRYRPMMATIEMPETCVTSILGSRCHAALHELRTGLDIHTNCQDTLAECIGEYGLTTDDVHDSFCIWMNSDWTVDGQYLPLAQRNSGRKGDYIDLLALMDVLAVPVICGGGGETNTANCWLKPVQIQSFEPSNETKRLTQDYLRIYTGLKNQRTVKDFRIKEIRNDRELKPTPGYVPHFINFPIKIQKITIELTEEDYRSIQRLKEQGLGEDDEDAVRSSVMDWYLNNRCNKYPSKPIVE